MASQMEYRSTKKKMNHENLPQDILGTERWLAPHLDGELLFLLVHGLCVPLNTVG